MNGLFNFTLATSAKFGFSDVLALLCGLALFLYGMDVMGESLKKSAGSSLKTFLGKMTTNPIKGATQRIFTDTYRRYTVDVRGYSCDLCGHSDI